MGFSDLKDDIRFGEVAMAPPTLTAKPRKAEMKDVRNNLLLSTMVQNTNSKNRNNEGKNKSNSRPIKKAQKLKTLSALQKSNLLNERQRVVDKYRKLKDGNLNKVS